ncbi:MAG TPA: glycosyltransferase family 39 protein [Acidimicrobiales bacterium]|nr:glycosyltransferase family 39 protein [Acidimicrobiales bacterium]
MVTAVQLDAPARRPTARCRARATGAALAAVAALAGLSYAWSMGRDPLEPYYEAAVRSMAGSWHNFAFGAFDPAGTVTLDKLPGAFWLQALSVRAFGFHTWAIVLPQVAEGVGAVLVLYLAVRRLAGPGAGLIAAVVLAASPAAVAVNRGNVSDSLMILLVLLAFDATSKAVVRGRVMNLVGAGVWVGLAFQAKMIEAWMVLPAFGLTYLVAAPGPLARRARHVVVLGAVAAAVSLLWMTAVSLFPSAHRPYVDGSHHDSVYEQVFVYNGLGRFGEQTPLQLLAGQSVGLALPTGQAPAWDRLVTGALGRDAGWLVPPALLAGALVMLERRRLARTDPVRAAVVLWGVWLLTLLVVFSVTSTINPYYTAALAPPVGALIGIGAVAAWKGRHVVPAAAVVVVAVAYADWLIPPSGTGRQSWLPIAAVAVGAVALIFLAGSALRPSTSTDRAAVAASLAALLLVPAVTCAVLVKYGQGAFDTPFEPAAAAARLNTLFVQTPTDVKGTVPALERARFGAPDLLAVQTSAIASVFIDASGQEALPIGGFTGTIPVPSLAELREGIKAGTFHLALVGHSSDPRIQWITNHCRHLGLLNGPLGDYFCTTANG